MNNAFREVAVKFALVVADKAYGDGVKVVAGKAYSVGYREGYDSVYFSYASN